MHELANTKYMYVNVISFGQHFHETHKYAVVEGNVGPIRIIGKRDYETCLVYAEVWQGDNVTEDQLTVVVELKKVST